MVYNPLERMMIVGTTVNLEGVTLPLFATVAVFLMVIFSLLSLGVVRLFQKRTRSGILNIVASAFWTVLFIAVLNIWFI